VPLSIDTKRELAAVAGVSLFKQSLKYLTVKKNAPDEWAACVLLLCGGSVLGVDLAWMKITQDTIGITYT